MTVRKLAAASATALLGISLTACSSSTKSSSTGSDSPKPSTASSSSSKPSTAHSSASKPSVPTLTNKAKTAALSAKSTSMSVSGSVQGQTVTLEASGTMDGSNQRQVQSASKLKSEEFIVAKTAYFKANSEFLAAQGMDATQSKKMADKWWSKPLGNNTQGAAADVKTMINQFFTSSDGKKLSSNAAEAKESTTQGQETYTISDPKNPKGAKLVVTRGSSPQIVEIQDYASQLTQNTKATYTFKQWNSVPMFQAPSGSMPISKAPIAKDGGSSSSSSSAPTPSSSK